jgi:hypothetical protein
MRPAKAERVCKDSLLEEAGFEPPVPPGNSVAFTRPTRGAEADRMVAEASISFEGDQQFESRSLQRRVSNKLFLALGVDGAKKTRATLMSSHQARVRIRMAWNRLAADEP